MEPKVRDAWWFGRFLFACYAVGFGLALIGLIPVLHFLGPDAVMPFISVACVGFGLLASPILWRKLK